MVKADEVVHAAGDAGNGSVVILYDTLLEDVSVPVKVLFQKAFRTLGLEVLRAHHHALGLIEFLAVHGTVASGEGLLDTGAGLEVDVRAAAVLGALGGDHDDAARRRGSVQSGGGSILQDGHAFNVVRVEGTAGDAVNHVERVGAGRNGTGTANANLGGLARHAAGVHDDDAGRLALDHGAQVGGGIVKEFLAAEGNHGAGKFVLFLGGVTHDDDFVQEIDVFLHEDFELASAVQRFHHIGVTEKIEGEGGVLSGIDRKAAVHVGDGAAAGGNNDSDADERLTRHGVLNRTRHGVLRKGRNREQAQKN